jgi:phage protein D
VALGWDNDPLVFKGVYTVDEMDIQARLTS